MTIPSKTTAQKELSGTARACRMTVDLEGRPAGNARPPRGFSARQKRLWDELFTLLDDANVLTHLDLPALAALVLAYEFVLYGEPSLPDIKIFMYLLGRFGCVPADRGRVMPVKKREMSKLDQLRAKRAASGG